MRNKLIGTIFAAGAVVLPTAGLVGGAEFLADGAGHWQRAEHAVGEAQVLETRAAVIAALGGMLTVGFGVMGGALSGRALSETSESR